MRPSSRIGWAVLALAVPWAASAAEIEWLGRDNSDFHNPANWAGGVIPGAGDTAVISAKVEWHPITLGEDVYLDGLLFGVTNGAGSWASTTIDGGGSLHVHDLMLDPRDADLYVDYGSLYVEGGRLHAAGDGTASLWGLLDVAAADKDPFDVAGMTHLYLGGPLRVSGETDNVNWLPAQVEFTSGPRCLVYDYEEVSDTTTIEELSRLQAGDADMDYDHDQLDMVQVLQAAKYLTGQTATWGEGDWNGAPGGCPGNPPPGDGVFNQLDIIAALNNGYLTGPYAGVAPSSNAPVPVPESSTLFLAVVALVSLLAFVYRRRKWIAPVTLAIALLASTAPSARAELFPFGVLNDEQTSIVYYPETGEMAIDSPVSRDLTSYFIDSYTWIFGNEPCGFERCKIDVWWATFGSTRGSHSLGTVAEPGLCHDFLLDDLIVVGSLAGGSDLGPVDLVYMHDLFPGDGNRDFAFDQLDIVRVLQVGKYLTGEAATWGDGDWNGGPGGYPGEPPPGDGLFNQLDVVAALQTGKYLSGAYAAILAGGVRGDERTSIVYNVATGEIAVESPASRKVAVINIDSAAGIFTGLPSPPYWENDPDNNLFLDTFGFRDHSIGNVAQPGLSEVFVANDLTVVGSLAGGGDLGSVDLIYVPEPSALLLATMGIAGLLAFCWPLARRVAPLTLAIVLLADTLSSAGAELLPDGVLNDQQTSIVYHPETGELAVDAPAEKGLYSIAIASTECIFTEDYPKNLSPSFDGASDCQIWKASWGPSWGSLSFGNVTRAGLSQSFVIHDLFVAGNLAASGGLGPVDLVYMHELLPGDANRNFAFDQLDIVQVLQAGKYLTGDPATWSTGDWNGGPGGYPGAPPSGDGVFDQLDIVAALQTGKYLSGAYAAIKPGGVRGDEQTSIVYDPRTGEVAVDAPASTHLTSINIESVADIFNYTDSGEGLGGGSGYGADHCCFDVPFVSESCGSRNIFLASFGGSFGSLSVGPVAQAGLSRALVANDLTVVGSLSGGGALGDVDLIYVPEPSALLLATMCITGLLAFCWRLARRTVPCTLAIVLLAALTPSADAAIGLNGMLEDEQTSIVYYPETGELAVDAPGGWREVSQIAIDSSSWIFTWERVCWQDRPRPTRGFDTETCNYLRTEVNCEFCVWPFSLGNVVQPGLTPSSSPVT